jgi:type II secretory pathway pseudopilin PulG
MTLTALPLLNHLVARWHSNSMKGFSIVEIVIVAGLSSIVLLGLIQLIVFSTRPIKENVRETEATFLAEEAIEVARVLRNESWTTNIATLSAATNYYPVISSGSWTLSTTDPGAINGIYTRIVTLAAVNRDGNDDIAATGTDDPNTKKITATVSWTERGAAQSVTIETYITNFLVN